MIHDSTDDAEYNQQNVEPITFSPSLNRQNTNHPKNHHQKPRKVIWKIIILTVLVIIGGGGGGMIYWFWPSPTIDKPVYEDNLYPSAQDNGIGEIATTTGEISVDSTNNDDEIDSGDSDLEKLLQEYAELSFDKTLLFERAACGVLFERAACGVPGSQEGTVICGALIRTIVRRKRETARRASCSSGPRAACCSSGPRAACRGPRRAR